MRNVLALYIYSPWQRSNQFILIRLLTVSLFSSVRAYSHKLDLNFNKLFQFCWCFRCLVVVSPDAFLMRNTHRNKRVQLFRATSTTVGKWPKSLASCVKSKDYSETTIKNEGKRQNEMTKEVAVM